jgi:Secretion system C-terminal sorting domain
MKKLYLLTAIIFIGFAVQAQNTPELTKTAWLTNNTGKVMQAYPNPATDQVIIQHVSSTQTAVISIVSTSGKVLQQHTVVPNTLQTELHIGLLNKGIYIVRFDDGKSDVRTLQLVKN